MGPYDEKEQKLEQQLGFSLDQKEDFDLFILDFRSAFSLFFYI
jgi:hypothetical protein